MPARGDRFRLEGTAGSTIKESDLDALRGQCRRKQNRLGREEREAPHELSGWLSHLGDGAKFGNKVDELAGLRPGNYA